MPHPLGLELDSRAKFLGLEVFGDLDEGIITTVKAAVLNSYQVR